jgi:hypothetical protein
MRAWFVAPDLRKSPPIALETHGATSCVNASSAVIHRHGTTDGASETTGGALCDIRLLL